MFLRDLRIAARTLLRTPAFTITALITLILGIGANATVFSIISAVLLRPLPFPEPDRLVQVREVSGRGGEMQAAWKNFSDWRARSTQFDQLVAHYPGGESTVLGLGEALRMNVAGVSEGFFRALRAEPAMGRGFGPEEHRLGAAPVAVVSHTFWRTQLGGSSNLSQRRINVDGFDLEIIGVMPPGFDYPNASNIWMPLELDEQNDSRTSHNFIVFGRLKAGSTLERADAELDAITKGFLTADPGAANEDGFEDYFPREARVVSLHEALVGNTRRPMLVLLGAALLVLLLACTNLASTTLARGTAREREFAVRHAMGGSYARVAASIFAETIVLTITGGALGLLLGGLALRLLPRVLPSGLPRMEAVSLNLQVVGFTIVLSLLAALLTGLWPALRLSGGAMRSLRSGGRGTDTRHSQRVWKILVGAEVAFALLLLIGAGLLLRSFQTIMNVQPGFRAEGVLTATLNPPSAKYGDRDVRRAYYERLAATLATVPGVESTGFVLAPPMSWVPNGLIDIEAGAKPNFSAEYQLADPGYFRTLDIPLLRGRHFTAADRVDAEHVVIVNRALAELAWPGEDPIGKRITGGGMDNYWDQKKWATVIGVVADVRQRDLTRRPSPTMFFAYTQRPQRSWSMTAVVRAANGDALSISRGIRDAIARVDRDVPVRFATMDERIQGALEARRFILMLITAFALLALLLASVGVFGVVGYAVARRRREIGIRIALGAQAPMVRREIQRDYLVPVAGGVAIGIVLALALTRTMTSLLYEVQPTDPLTFAGVVLVLGAVGWVASFIPSFRSSRADPLKTMRME